MKDAPSTDAVSYGLARPDQIATLTGLEQLQAMLRGELPAPTICRALDFILTEAGDGWAEFRGTPSGDMLNPMGLVHGGWVMTLLDSALGCAVHTTLAPGETYVSLDTDVKFVKPITPATGEVTVTARIQTRGRQVGTSEGRAVDAQGRILALGTSSCLVRQAPEA